MTTKELQPATMPLSNNVKAFLSFLLILVIASLALNAFLMWQWLGFMQQVQVMGQQVQIAADKAVADLSDFENSSITFTVPVRDNIEVNANVKYKGTIDVPIDLSVPIDEEVKTQIPLKINDVTIPIEVTVPVKMNIPVNSVQKVNLDLTIPIKTTVPINLDIPVDIKLSETGLGPYIGQFRQMLQQMNETLSTELP